MGRLHIVVIALALMVFAACRHGEDRLSDRLSFAAEMLDGELGQLEAATATGKPCYPIIDGQIHYKLQDAGHEVAKTAREIEDRFNFVVVAFDAYKTPVKDRYEALAARIDAWKSGPYARAIATCGRCAADIETGGALAERCTVP